MKSAKGVVTGFEGDVGTGSHGFLDEVAALLQPDNAAGADSAPDPAGHVRRLLVLPNGRSPRVLLPMSPRRVALGLLHAQAVTRSRTDRLMRLGAGGAMALGLGGLLSRTSVELTVENGIEQHLGALLGQPVRIGVRLGPPRANRKPVLAICDLSGVVLAFAKLGIGDLTDRLALAEADALRAIGHLDLATIRAPRLLYAGRWKGRALVVQAALPVLPTATSDPDLRLAAMAELAVSGGVVEESLRTSSFTSALRADLGKLDDPFADELRAVAEQVVASELTLRFGAWHGDWSPSNMQCVDGHVLLWDWERYATGVPVGMDAVHFAFAENVSRRGLTHRDAADSCLLNAATILEPMGVPASKAGLVAALTLLSLGARYAGDRQLDAGATVGRLDEWLIPAIAARVAAGEFR